jgi:hypothetical protein
MIDATFDRWFCKAVHPDFTTRGGFRWPYPGGWVTDPADTDGAYTDEVCPAGPGDGLSVAKTLFGMAQGGYQPVTVLVVGCDDEHVICEDDDKAKLRTGMVVDVWDGIRLIRQHGRGADLRGAYLTGAYLRGAYLRGADLTGAYLAGADLTRAEGYNPENR